MGDLEMGEREEEQIRRLSLDFWSRVDGGKREEGGKRGGIIFHSVGDLAARGGGGGKKKERRRKASSFLLSPPFLALFFPGLSCQRENALEKSRKSGGERRKSMKFNKGGLQASPTF